jgi:hypothetical protein
LSRAGICIGRFYEQRDSDAPDLVNVSRQIHELNTGTVIVTKQGHPPPLMTFSVFTAGFDRIGPRKGCPPELVLLPESQRIVSLVTRPDGGSYA